MTCASALVTVGPETLCTTADELARRHDFRHIVVVAEGNLLGIACRCDLFPAPDFDERIAARMSRDIFAIHPAASLGEALAAMNSLQVGCLPVVRDGLLLGLITRGDLRRVGIPESELGAHRCAACGSVRGVRADPKLPALELCLDCLDLLADAEASVVTLGEAE
jgi:CBS-domain-containing membrane protein